MKVFFVLLLWQPRLPTALRAEDYACRTGYWTVTVTDVEAEIFALAESVADTENV
jgi:hypothetical protein